MYIVGMAPIWAVEIIGKDTCGQQSSALLVSIVVCLATIVTSIVSKSIMKKQSRLAEEHWAQDMLCILIVVRRSRNLNTPITLMPTDKFLTPSSSL